MTDTYNEEDFWTYVTERHEHSFRVEDASPSAETIVVPAGSVAHLMELATAAKAMGIVPAEEVQAVIGSSWMSIGATREDADNGVPLPDEFPQRIDDLTAMAYFATMVVMAAGGPEDAALLSAALQTIQPLMVSHTKAIDAKRLAAGEVTQDELDAEYAEVEAAVDALFS